jgi:hypothetical protein
MYTINQLEDFGLYQQWGEQHKYKFTPEGKWLTADSKDAALEMAQGAAVRNRDKLRTASQRYDDANAQELIESHQKWGGLTDEQLRTIIERDAREAKALQNNREIVDGRYRRTSAATANQGARESFEVVQKMKRYLEARVP